MNEKPKFPVILTYYDDNIDTKIVEYQHRVVQKVTQNRLAFRPLRSPFDYRVMGHGDMLNRAIFNLFYETTEQWDCVLILDIDCIPLSYEAIEFTLITAYNGNLVGNIQRANHLENNKHTYVAPSYMCFTKDYYEDVGCPTFNNTHKYDVGELMTVNAEKLNRPSVKFMPVHVEHIFTGEEAKYYRLADNMPNYGIGTTFGHNGMPISYHLFAAAQNRFNHMFYKKCESILNS
jgi:hypothetical protein